MKRSRSPMAGNDAKRKAMLQEFALAKSKIKTLRLIISVPECGMKKAVTFLLTPGYFLLS